MDHTQPDELEQFAHDAAQVGITVMWQTGDEDEISNGLRRLTAAIKHAGGKPASGLLGGEMGYGARWQVPGVWGMHPYCWCEQDDCRWCAGCTCPDDAYSYRIAGVEASFEEWLAEPWQSGQAETIVDPEMQCGWCTGETPAAAHFWHEPSGTRVRWYKYIGRDMEIRLGAAWPDILADCLASVSHGSDQTVIAPLDTAESKETA